MNPRPLTRLLALLALAATLGSCAGSRGTLSQKTRWYRHHSGSKTTPCPCGH